MIIDKEKKLDEKEKEIIDGMKQLSKKTYQWNKKRRKLEKDIAKLESRKNITVERLKENILDASPKLQDILSLNVKNYNYIGEDSKQIGFIAQEFEQVFPSLVTERDTRKYDEDGNLISGFEDTKGLKVGMEFAILVKAIQEQQEIINDLKARIETLENQ